MDPVPVSLRSIFLYFLRLGTLGFGGPAALVGYMQRDLVDQKGWVSADEFSQGVALAATLPGPLAAQVAMWIGYLRQGFWGCTVASIAFIGPPFLLVLILASVYVRFEEASWIRALFYGIGPAVAALIAEACYNLAKRYITDGKMIVLALACLAVTVIVQAEMALLFIAGGLIGILLYASARAKPTNPVKPSLPMFAGISVAGLIGAISLSKPGELALFFFKAGAFTFGSGLAVAPFIHQGLVVESHWLTERQFLDTVAVGMITPGPVVIMSTFAGFLIDGVRGAIVASVAVFLPIYLMVVSAASYLARHRDHPIVSGFVKGATIAAVGSISGAGIIIAGGVIVDGPTAAIAVLSLVLIMKWKVPAPAIVTCSGIMGLLIRG